MLLTLLDHRAMGDSVDEALGWLSPCSWDQALLGSVLLLGAAAPLSENTSSSAPRACCCSAWLTPPWARLPMPLPRSAYFLGAACTPALPMRGPSQLLESPDPSVAEPHGMAPVSGQVELLS